MVFKLYSFITTVLILAMIFVFLPQLLIAAEVVDTNDIAEGFNEYEAEPSEDIVEGFDDEIEDEQNRKSDDDILEGFEETGQDTGTAGFEDGPEPSVFSLDGYLKLGSSWNVAHQAPKAGETDWRGLSCLRVESQLDLSTKLSDSWQAYISAKGAYDFAYCIRGRDEFTDAVLDNYEKELEFRETYILGSPFHSLDIKAGRQIVVWGKSDNIRVTDVLNPLDMREPGLTDIEDLRLPVTMTRLDYYAGDWNVTGIAIHEIRFNKSPEYGSDFYPVTASPLPEDIPPDSMDNIEFAIAISGIFSGWDIAFYWADIYNDAPHRELIASGPPPQYEMKHARLAMIGTAFNAAVGNWLLKAELARFDGLKFYNAAGNTYSRTDVFAGIEYSGFKDTTISVEAVNRHINNFSDALKEAPDEANENEYQSVVRLTRNFLNETLTITLLASTFGETGQDGAFQRFTGEYDVTDSVKVTGGAVFYQSGDLARFRNIGDNDRLFVEIRYSF